MDFHLALFTVLWIKDFRVHLRHLQKMTLHTNIKLVNNPKVLNPYAFLLPVQCTPLGVRLIVHSLVCPFIHDSHNDIIHSFIRSFVHSFILSFVHSFIRSFVHSFMRSFVHSFIRSFVHSFIHSFIHSFVRPSVRPSVLSSLPSFFAS